MSDTGMNWRMVFFYTGKRMCAITCGFYQYISENDTEAVIFVLLSACSSWLLGSSDYCCVYMQGVGISGWYMQACIRFVNG